MCHYDDAEHKDLFCFDVGILINQINSQFQRNVCLITSHKKIMYTLNFIC